ncbi:MAG TPA: hypothetical protein VN908_01685 [Gemmatimonadales bacterium]|nr:hypothetical protein [Gemmatimonadales bacterium]
MRLARSSLIRTLTTLVVSGCIGGTGSGLTGISTGTSGTPRVLAFTAQPSSGTAGQIITPAIQVTARDTAGKTVTTFTGTITVALGTNPTGGFLSGTKTVAAVLGVASFGDLSVDRAGTGFKLAASSSGATAATSTTFNIVTAPTP